MTALILGLAIEFFIRSVLLTLALWIMIRFQKLEWDLLGLVSSALLGSALDMIPYVGHYLAVPALWLCLKWATNGDLFPDVAFTVGVGYALVFCMNLFLLGSLLGDLRPSRRHADPEPSAKHENLRPSRPAPPANNGADKKLEADKPLPVNEPTPAVATAVVTAVAPPPKAPQPAPQPSGQPVAKSTREIVRDFSVRGIIEGSDRPVATINSGVRSYTLLTGETRSMETKDGRIAVRFDGVRDHQVLLTVAGEQTALSY